MKLYAPKYYEEFKCIADKCTHSCCIGWEIDVDENSYKKYKKSKCQYAKAVLSSIENGDTPHFALKENDRCPHLDERGLCKIIINMGEGYLCDICREHPRFYNFTNYGKEVGIGMSCPEACRIILNSDDYDEFECKKNNYRRFNRDDKKVDLYKEDDLSRKIAETLWNEGCRIDALNYKVVLDTLEKNYGDRILFDKDGSGGSLKSLIELLKKKCQEK